MKECCLKYWLLKGNCQRCAIYGRAESSDSKTQLFWEIKPSNCGLVIRWNHQGMISQWFMISWNHRPTNEVNWCSNRRKGNDGEAQQLFWDVISAFVKIYTREYAMSTAFWRIVSITHPNHTGLISVAVCVWIWGDKVTTTLWAIQ